MTAATRTGNYSLVSNPRWTSTKPIRKVVDGKGKEGGQPMSVAAYQTLIVKFSEYITDWTASLTNAETWGVDILKKWIDNYESSRFTTIDSHTVAITSKYNMKCLKA